ncbi:MAG TPA: autotransporter-associated beta strand repeat-containing protein [Verrucomicrobiae bacterium]|nr:autotransporter-associated beta strand repeat-containing protein [Verrucomicrobiae bacterium]
MTMKHLSKLQSSGARFLAALAIIIISALASRGQTTLTWDANGGSGPSDGSGTWHNPGDWWDGTAATSWTDGSAAVIGAGSGAPGNYVLTVDTTVTATTYTFNPPGAYDVVGPGTLDYTVSSGTGLSVGAGMSLEMDAPVKSAGSGANIVVGANSVLTMTGGFSQGGGSPNWNGNTAATSTINISNNVGAFTDNGTWDINGVTINVFSNALFEAASRADVGRNSAATVNVSGGGIITENNSGTTANSINNSLQISRGNPGIVNIQNGGTIYTYAGEPAGGYVRLIPDSSSQATLNVFPGGVLSVGTGSLGFPGFSLSTLRPITLLDGPSMSYSATASGIVNISGGEVAASGIEFGGAGGTFNAATIAQLNITGGTVYLDAGGIYIGASSFTNARISLNGGVIAATANWASSMPMVLGTTNGSVTFLTADTNATPHNITLSGNLSGPGGLTAAGGGVLTLSGSNSFSGPIVVSNGTFTVSEAFPSTNGTVTVEGPAIDSTQVTSAGDFWTVSGLTYDTGTPTADFNFGVNLPSTEVAPIQVNGALAFNVQPNFTVEAGALPTGVYPLIQYAALSGTVPSSVTLTVPQSSGLAGSISNDTTHKIIYLVVSSGTPSVLTWKAGNGPWDFTTENWTLGGSSSVAYSDGEAVVLADETNGTSPITITLNTTVQPLSILDDALHTSYIISGSGSIAGATGVTVGTGAGSSAALTLANANTYTGGTTVNGSQLNINNGGDGSTTSAVGTGTLTLTNNAVIDNTSGSALTLLTPIPEAWANFTYAGSQTNLNLGVGAVTLGQNVNLTVNSNTLIAGGPIQDNGNNYSLTKLGNGALTLAVGNSFGGGMNLAAGQLNLNDPNGAAPGAGIFDIDNGTFIDNTSGAAITMQPVQMNWNGNFTFIGSADLNLGAGEIGLGIVSGGTLTLTVNNNTLETDGEIDGLGKTIAKAGNGTWVIGGMTANNGLTIIDNVGTIVLAKTVSTAYAVGYSGMVVNTNATAVCGGFGSSQFDNSSLAPLTVNDGLFDLAGTSQEIFSIAFNGGTLANSASNTISMLTTETNGVVLGTNDICAFNVAPGSSLVLTDTVAMGSVSGYGSLAVTNTGTLVLWGTNTYTGDTIIDSGTLALVSVGSISNQGNINLASTNSSLDLSGDTDTTGNTNMVLTLLPGQTLSGFGVVTGLVESVSGSTVSPGSASTVGTLTVTGTNGANTLNGTTIMKLNKSNHTSDRLAVSGSLAYGGTLVLTNLSGSLATGDSFQLFSAPAGYSGAFANVSPSRPGYPGFGLAWNLNNLAVNGTISIVGAPVPASPKITGVSLSGTTLMISGTNGVANEPFVLLESTNLAAGPTGWVPVSTNTFDGSGKFDVSIATTEDDTQEFFTLLMQ